MTTETSTVGYQFTPMPKKLTHLLDVNLRSMLFALVDASDYFADEDGWFYRSNADLQIDSAMSQNLVKATVDTLFIYSLLEVTCVGKGKKREPNGYRLNKGMFLFFERLDMNSDIKRPENKINTVEYKGSGYHPSYLDDEPERYFPELVKGKIIWNQINGTKASTTDDTAVPKTESTKELTTDVTKSDNNIDNIENGYNIEYIDNIEYTNNTENVNKDLINTNNILKENLDYEKEKLERIMEEGVTEPMTRNEEEGKENPNGSQFNKKLSGENQDCIPGEVQDGEAKGEGSSRSQSNDEESEQQQKSKNCLTTGNPLEEAVCGIKMVGLFDDQDPSKEIQSKPILSVRAATRIWAEEQEAKYQSRERTLQNLAMDHPLGFEKYVNYLKLNKRPAFQKHKELIHDLAVTWEIDVDLDQD